MSTIRIESLANRTSTHANRLENFETKQNYFTLLIEDHGVENIEAHQQHSGNSKSKWIPSKNIADTIFTGKIGFIRFFLFGDYAIQFRFHSDLICEKQLVSGINRSICELCSEQKRDYQLNCIILSIVKTSSQLDSRLLDIFKINLFFLAMEVKQRC